MKRRLVSFGLAVASILSTLYFTDPKRFDVASWLRPAPFLMAAATIFFMVKAQKSDTGWTDQRCTLSEVIVAILCFLFSALLGILTLMPSNEISLPAKGFFLIFMVGMFLRGLHHLHLYHFSDWNQDEHPFTKTNLFEGYVLLGFVLMFGMVMFDAHVFFSGSEAPSSEQYQEVTIEGQTRFFAPEQRSASNIILMLLIAHIGVGLISIPILWWRGFFHSGDQRDAAK